MIVYKVSTTNFINVFKLSDKYSVPFIYPTDTIFGIGAHFLNVKANQLIYQIKQREKNKPLLVLIGSFDQLFMLIDNDSFDNVHKKIINRLWPGEFTLIFKAKKSLPNYLVNEGKVAVRFPKFRELTLAIKSTFPITSTSANISNDLVCYEFKEILYKFKNKIDYFVYKETQSGTPSTIIDISNSKKPVFIRNPKCYKLDAIIN